jgi:Spy/CpxP family protein refolding chaperone
LREHAGFVLKNLDFSRWHTPCNEPFRRGNTRGVDRRQIKSKPIEEEHSMKKILTMLAVTAALCLGADSLLAQQDNGGGGGGRRGGGGGGNFDPAQRQQMMMDRYKEDLGFTNDTDWSAVEPLVQKVVDARRDSMSGAFGQFRGRRGGNTDNGGGNPNRPQPPANPDREALQQAVDSNVPSGQLAAALSKYRASQKAKQSKLEQAQSDLAKVLTPKQEAQAVLAGLLN